MDEFTEQINALSLDQIQTFEEVDVCRALMQGTNQDATIVKQCEEQLRLWEIRPKFFLHLFNIIANREYGDNIRFLAVLYFKNGVERYWRRNAPNGILESEKDEMREKFPILYSEMNMQILIQIATITSRIARLDYPKKWPNIVDDLVAAIQSKDEKMFQYTCILKSIIHMLATKRLSGDRAAFSELTGRIYTKCLFVWNENNAVLLNPPPYLRESTGVDLMPWCMCLRVTLNLDSVLKYLTIHGINHADQGDANAKQFMHTTCSVLKHWKEIRADSSVPDMILNLVKKREKTLLKTLILFFEMVPVYFADYVASILEQAYATCFALERVIRNVELYPRWITFMKKIISCPEYSMNIPGEYRVDALKSITASEAIARFFTPDVIRSIMYEIVWETYFVLSENELQYWNQDPMGYVVEESVDCWKFSLRPHMIGLFQAMIKKFNVEVRQLLLDLKPCTLVIVDSDDLVGILKKESLYHAYGLAVWDLSDDLIDYNKWLTHILIPELRNKSPYYVVLRRRILWLIGYCSSVKLDMEMCSLLYAEVLENMKPEENFVVRVEAVKTMRSLLDDYDFSPQQMLPFIPACFHYMQSLLKESRECESKLDVLNAMTVLLSRMGWEVGPHFEKLVEYLPELWDHSRDHAMLRVAIISTLSLIVKGLSSQCTRLKNFILPILRYSLDDKQEGFVYVHEEGLQLLKDYVENTKKDEDVLILFPFLLHNLNQTTENLKIIISIMSSFMLLFPEILIEKFGSEIFSVISVSYGEVKEEAKFEIIGFYDKCLQLNWRQSLPLMTNFLCEILDDFTFAAMEKKFMQSNFLLLIGRCIWQCSDVFFEILERVSRKRFGFKTEEQVFYSFVERACAEMKTIWPKTIKKLIAFAMAKFCPLRVSWVSNNMRFILDCIFTASFDILSISTGNGCTYTDTLMWEDKKASDSIPQHGANGEEEETQQELRLFNMYLTDPVHSVDFVAYIKEQLTQMRQKMGKEAFERIVEVELKNNLEQVAFSLLIP